MNDILDVHNYPSLEKPQQIDKDDLFYGSVFAGGDVKSNYITAKEEISRTGDSPLIQEQKDLWNREQEANRLPDLEALLQDTTISPEIRRKAAENYITSGAATLDLRDKYLIKKSAIDTSFDIADQEAQDIYAEAVLQRDAATKQKVAVDSIEKGKSSFINDIKKVNDKVFAFNEAALTIVSNIIQMVPAGFFGIYEATKTQDPEKAQQIIDYVLSHAYKPETDSTQQILKFIADKADWLSTPFKAFGDFINTKVPWATTDPRTGELILNRGLGAEAAVVAELGSEGLVTGGIARIVGTTASAASKAIKAGKDSVPPLSPLNTVETASKEASVKLGVEALKDKTKATVEALDTTKAAIINDKILPKIQDEYVGIHPDYLEKLTEQDKVLTDLYKKQELDPKLADVDVIKNERDLYVKVLAETEKPHLLLSSSVIGSDAKAFGRVEGGYEALIDTSYKHLTGTAVFGRNSYWGFKTERTASNYLNKLKESTKHLPEPGEFSLVQRDGEHFVTWKFKRDYNQWESLVYGDDTLGAHLFSPRLDITWFANKLGTFLFPSYMRMKGSIPASQATTALTTARIEGKFINAQRQLVMGTDHPKELINFLRQGEKEGKVYSFNDIKNANPHLKEAEVNKLYGEYAGYRRIQDHLYRFSDRIFRRDLKASRMESLYDAEGKHLGFASKDPIDLADLNKADEVWDITNKTKISRNKLLDSDVVVKLKTPVVIKNEKFNYAKLDSTHQFGPIRAGALTKIPGYIARHYKEWFVVYKQPSKFFVDGRRVGKSELPNHRVAIGMAGTRKEAEQLAQAFRDRASFYRVGDPDDIDDIIDVRPEQKNIEDVIMHDSHIYDTFLKEHHVRGEQLPGLNRETQLEDILVSQTKAIKAISKLTAWGEFSEANRNAFVKAYGEFTNGKFPDSISEISPGKRKLNDEEARRFLAAQKVYQQWEMQEITQTASDEVWKNVLNKVADVIEKTPIKASVLREWGEKGFVPARAAKALASNILMFARPARMWFVQTQQVKELIAISPSFMGEMPKIPALLSGLLARSSLLSDLRSGIDDAASRVVKVEYKEMVDALEESGILQAVDMNQTIHGFWRDSSKELNPPLADKIAGGIAGTVKAPFKFARDVGYDPAELTNQIVLWLFAKHRWEEINPGKHWNTTNAKEEIMQLQTRYGHIATTRAGMYTWQEGNLGVITQFAAIPFKSTLQMISAKEFTLAEKGRLAGARLFWYGKYGVPFGTAIYQLINRNLPDTEDQETLNKYSAGMTDYIYNNILHGLFDASNENTSVSASKSLSTVTDSVWFWDASKVLYDIAQGQPLDKNNKFPFVTAGASVYKSVQGMYDLFTLPAEIGEESDWKAATWGAVSFVATLSDYSKSQVVEQLNSSGRSLGYQQTSGEAVARIIGIHPKSEDATWGMYLPQKEREKQIADDAKKIHERLMFYAKYRDNPSEVENRISYIKGMKAFLARVPESYREEVTQEILNLDRKSHTTTSESLFKYGFSHAKSQNDSFMKDFISEARNSTDPSIINMVKEYDNNSLSE